MDNICIFGDSITWGASDMEKGGWVNRLWLYSEKELEEEVYLYNLGIPCETSEDLLKRIKNECKPRNPSKIVIAIGINDTKYTTDINKPVTDITVFENNLQKLIDIVINFTGNITFIGLTPVNELVTKSDDPNITNHYDNDLIKKYDDVIQNIAEANDLDYIYIFDKIKMSDLNEDGIHPNDSGHKKIFEHIKERLF